VILNKILIDNLKCKIIFLFNGAKNTEVKAIPRKYRSELKQLFNELQNYISPEGYEKFIADCLGIELKGPVEQAEDIIRNFYKNL
jgi:hypothetical protein